MRSRPQPSPFCVAPCSARATSPFASTTSLTNEGALFFERPLLSLVEALTVSFRSEETTATFSVLVTGEEAIAHDIFAWNGWIGGGQAVLVHDPDADLKLVVQALQRGMDWRDRLLPPGVRLLFGSGHDGCFGLVAAVTPEILDKVVSDLHQELGAV